MQRVFISYRRQDSAAYAGRLYDAMVARFEERNVFLGEATVPIDLAQLPPGMEGTARIDAGARSSFWVLSHRLTDWLRLNFWL